MQIFIIGATGYIGSTVAQALQAAGHRVLGLARSPTAEQTLRARHIIPQLGDLTTLEGVVAGAMQADVTIYIAAAETFVADRRAVEAILGNYRGSGKRFIFTSGSAVFADRAEGSLSATIFTEAMAPIQPLMHERIEIEQLVLRAHSHGVRTTVLRPPLVYGRGGSIQVPLLIEIARTTGTARYIGRGENRWSTVHVDDLAASYLLLLHHPGSGEIFHIASDEVKMRDLADAVGRLLKLGPAVPWSTAEAQAWGSFAGGLGSNSRISAAKARQQLGWRPLQPGVLADIEAGSYRRSTIGHTTDPANK